MLINVALVAAIIYGAVTHKRWLWISAGAIFIVLFAAFFLLSGVVGGHGYGGYIIK